MRHFACAARSSLLLPALAGSAGEDRRRRRRTIKVEGMPPIPQSIADGLARYAQFRQAQMIAWHPTKRQVLITTAFGSVPQLHLVDGPGRDRAPADVSRRAACRAGWSAPLRSRRRQYASSFSATRPATSSEPVSLRRDDRRRLARRRVEDAVRRTSGRARASGSPTTRPSATARIATSTSSSLPIPKTKRQAGRLRRAVRPAGLVARRRHAARDRGRSATSRPMSGASTSRPARRRR